jgi:hypothetical protein
MGSHSCSKRGRTVESLSFASLANTFLTGLDSFIFNKQTDSTPGVDPIIGVSNDRNGGAGQPRPISGLNPNDISDAGDITLPIGRLYFSCVMTNLTLNSHLIDFVVSRGGEYFFTPSLSALLDPIAK